MGALQTVSRRVFLTLPDGVAADLDRWAEAENNKAATLAGFIVERAVREAKEQGKIPSEPNYKSLADLLTRNADALDEYGKIPEERIAALKKGDRPSELEIARLALVLKLDEDYVTLLVRGGS
ncbi:hypothetical protein [Leptolyngbya sp. FACHB-16]|uniref:ribbon-helix-helix domain-containing protein n=1 Tax=unclassified Leptolyngbya TaxID=2650499 RepID=UPI0018EF64E3|nr:hypothetical protein [Leptolyngbya sp. FACHB-16]